MFYKAIVIKPNLKLHNRISSKISRENAACQIWLQKGFYYIVAHTHLNHWWKFPWVVDLCDCVKPESLCKVDSKGFSNWLNQPGSQPIFDKHCWQQRCLWKRKKKFNSTSILIRGGILGGLGFQSNFNIMYLFFPWIKINKNLR